MKMNMKTLNDIKHLLNEVSDRIKDGEKEINFKDDQHYVSYFEGYVSGLTWVEEILGFIVDEIDKDTVSVENLFDMGNGATIERILSPELQRDIDLKSQNL
jgi:hypothetical protein